MISRLRSKLTSSSLNASLQDVAKKRLELPSSSVLGMERDVQKAGTVRQANVIGEWFGLRDGGAVYPLGGFQEELSEVRRGMPSRLQAMEEEGSEAFEVSLVRILPEISMVSPVN